MTGKIFKESSNIYEDEAKILFDYYKKAAEKIVEEEIDIENKIEAATKNKEQSAEKQHRHKVFAITAISIAGVALLGSIVTFILEITAAGFLLGCLFLGGAITAIVNFVKKNKSEKDVENFESNINSLDEAKKNIRRNYKVSKLGVAYVPIATRVPFEGKSFVVDHTGTMPNTNFSLSVLHQPKRLQESLASLEENLNNIPVVEGNEDAEQIDTSSYSKSIQNITMHNYMGNIDREVRNISYLLTDLKKELEKNAGGDNSNYFKSLIKKLGDSVQIVSKIKTSSTSGLLDYTNSILSAVLKSGYNQYSAQLEAEELSRIRNTNFNYQDCVESYKPFELKESSKVKYDIYNQNWVAEDNTRTIMPFGINQIEEEVLMPLINNLMQETRVERLKIYNNIKDQKLSYLNKWHQDVEASFRDNRKTGQDLITQITNAYAEYSTAHNTYLSYKQTQDAMKQTGRADIETKEVTSSDEAISEIEAKVESCKEVGDAFQLYMRTLQNDINASSEKFGFVEYFEGSLRDGESKKVADSIIPENLQSLDSRRQKIIPVNSYFATYAELPPSPSVEPKLMEDFSMDLQQIAASQINRIDEENSGLLNREYEQENGAPQEAQSQPEASLSSETDSTGDVNASYGESDASYGDEKTAESDFNSEENPADESQNIDADSENSSTRPEEEPDSDSDDEEVDDESDVDDEETDFDGVRDGENDE